nr:DUF2461 domain-containing protein [Tessaracoccus coleopterorum]
MTDFPSDAMSFYRELEQSNTREFWEANKTRYEGRSARRWSRSPSCSPRVRGYKLFRPTGMSGSAPTRRPTRRIRGVLPDGTRVWVLPRGQLVRGPRRRRILRRDPGGPGPDPSGRRRRRGGPANPGAPTAAARRRVARDG